MLSVCSAGACCGGSRYTVASVSVNQPCAPLPLPATSIFSVRYVHISAPSSSGQIAAEEIPDLLPAVVGRLHPVGRAVHREERVPGALVAVEFVFLACLGEDLVQFVDLLRGRVLVLGAEQPEQRAGQAGGGGADGA